MSAAKDTKGFRREPGIRVKLIVAFIAMLAATVAVGLAAGIFQTRIASLFSQVQEQNFPLATTALKLSGESGALAQAVRTLAQATDEERRAAAFSAVGGRQEVLERLMAELNRLGADPARLSDLQEILTEMTALIGRIDDGVRRQLEIGSRRAARMDDLGDAHTKLLAYFRPLATEKNLEIQDMTMMLPFDPGELTMMVMGLISSDVPVIQAFANIVGEVNLLVAVLGKADVSSSLQQVDALAKDFEEAADTVQFSADFLTGILQEETPRTLAEAVIAMGRGDNGIFELRRQELDGRAQGRAVLAELNNLVDRLNQATDALTASTEAATDAAGQQVDANISTALVTIMVIGAAALIAGVLFIWLLVQRDILARLGQLNTAMAAQAAGKLDIQIPGVKRGDEIGAMARALEVFKKNAEERDRLRQRELQKGEEEKQRLEEMRQLIQSFDAKARATFEEMARIGSNVTNNANFMREAAERTSAQTASAAAAASTTATNVETAAAAVEELSASSREIAQQASRSNNITREAVSKTGLAQDSMNRMARASQEITEVLTLISSVAHKTNLLALNATIEAARAGEAGRGFAVVANEVKVLAGQTAEATRKISQQIDQIQSAANESGAMIEAITKTVAEIDMISESIAAAVEQQSAATSSISENVATAWTATASVSTDLEKVSGEAEATNGSAAEVLKTALHLSGQSHALQDEVMHFLGSITKL